MHINHLSKNTLLCLDCLRRRKMGRNISIRSVNSTNHQDAQTSLVWQPLVHTTMVVAGALVCKVLFSRGLWYLRRKPQVLGQYPHRKVDMMVGISSLILMG